MSWDDAQIFCAAHLGMDVPTFWWGTSVAEIALYARAHAERSRLRHVESMVNAWHSAYLPWSKEVIPLKNLLGPEPDPRTPEQIEAEEAVLAAELDEIDRAHEERIRLRGG